MYFRVKRTGKYAYLQIVESFRQKRQVHQRVLTTVGRLDVLQATGQLETLMRSGLRFCEKLVDLFSTLDLVFFATGFVFK